MGGVVSEIAGVTARRSPRQSVLLEVAERLSPSVEKRTRVHPGSLEHESVSRLCAGLDAAACYTRPLQGSYPCVYLASGLASGIVELPIMMPTTRSARGGIWVLLPR
jgi:hypothetical protein